MDEVECPGNDCVMCNGEACNKCGAGLATHYPPLPRCEHDVVQRHEEPEMVNKVFSDCTDLVVAESAEDAERAWSEYIGGSARRPPVVQAGRRGQENQDQPGRRARRCGADGGGVGARERPGVPGVSGLVVHHADAGSPSDGRSDCLEILPVRGTHEEVEDDDRGTGAELRGRGRGVRRVRGGAERVGEPAAGKGGGASHESHKTSGEHEARLTHDLPALILDRDSDTAIPLAPRCVTCGAPSTPLEGVCRRPRCGMCALRRTQERLYQWEVTRALYRAWCGLTGGW